MSVTPASSSFSAARRADRRGEFRLGGAPRRLSAARRSARAATLPPRRSTRAPPSPRAARRRSSARRRTPRSNSVLELVVFGAASLRCATSARAAASIRRSFATCSLWRSSVSTPTVALLAMFLARFAYLSVLRVSSGWRPGRCTPPSPSCCSRGESCNSLVSFESRYGTYPPAKRRLSSPSALMTFPSASNPLLIWILHKARSALVRFALRPARSTRCIFGRVTPPSAPPLSTWIVNIATASSGGSSRSPRWLDSRSVPSARAISSADRTARAGAPTI